MAVGFVELRWDELDESPPFGYLNVEAQYQGFAGRGSAAIFGGDVTSFATEIRRYPLSDDPVTLRAGFAARKNQEEVLLIRLQVRPVGPLGRVGLSVQIAQDNSYPHAEQLRVGLDIPVTYEAIRQFADDILAVLVGGDVARIEAYAG